MKKSIKFTRKQYMDNEVSFHEYYLQFVTDSTRRFVENSIGLDKVLNSKCKHLNDIVNMSNRGWIWDYTPFNINLARELGEVGKNSIPAPSTCTCIGKAMAKEMAKQFRELQPNG